MTARFNDRGKPKDNRMALYLSGLSDRQIAAKVGVDGSAIRRWRMVRKLDANRPRSNAAVNSERRMKMYLKGYSDERIAKAEKVDPSSISAWRKIRNLPANFKTGQDAIPNDELEQRMAMYKSGKSDGYIAKALGCSTTNIYAWRKRNGLIANSANGWHTKRVKAEVYQAPMAPKRSADAVLLDRLKRSIGRMLPPDIADDVLSDLYVSLLSGDVKLNDIEKMAKKITNKFVRDYANKYGPRSLDEELGNEDGFRMIDMIRDDRSSSWLEEMGATVS